MRGLEDMLTFRLQGQFGAIYSYGANRSHDHREIVYPQGQRASVF